MEGEKILIYGDSGSGKTVLSSTAVDCVQTWPVVMMDTEAGTRSIKSKCRYLESPTELGSPEPGKVDVLRVRNWDEVTAVYDRVYDLQYKGKGTSYKCMILDSLTELSDVSVDESVKKPRKTPRVIQGHPDQNDYGTSFQYFKKFLRAIRDIDGLHLILTALVREREDKDKGISQIVPDIAGARNTNVAKSIVDFGGIMDVVPPKGDREITFKPTGRTWAKWREEGHPGKTILNPTIAKIFEEINNG